MQVEIADVADLGAGLLRVFLDPGHEPGVVVLEARIGRTVERHHRRLVVEERRIVVGMAAPAIVGLEGIRADLDENVAGLPGRTNDDEGDVLVPLAVVADQIDDVVAALPLLGAGHDVLHGPGGAERCGGVDQRLRVDRLLVALPGPVAIGLVVLPAQARDLDDALERLVAGLHRQHEIEGLAGDDRMAIDIAPDLLILAEPRPDRVEIGLRAHRVEARLHRGNVHQRTVEAQEIDRADRHALDEEKPREKPRRHVCLRHIAPPRINSAEHWRDGAPCQ